ncbi:MAG: uroporphyrinogen decarboxylase family protein [Verrucomicrobiales bacterium]|jgi:uroporphyrinogen decarboxylase|nr:uroporphyrinogen decarboxylase family protein [Verrucomicrobiales bacterium]
MISDSHGHDRVVPLTGRERILQTLRGEPADRVPVMLHCFMAAAREYGITMREYRESPEKMAGALSAFAQKYGLDGVMTDMDTALEAHALGATLAFPEDEPARVVDSEPQPLNRLIDSVDPQKLYRDPRIHNYLEGLRLFKRANPDLCLRGNADQAPFSIAMLLYGMQRFMEDLLDEDLAPDLLKLIDRCYDVHLEFHKMSLAVGSDLTSFGDSSCGPNLISRELYLKFGNPFHRRLQRDLAALGIQTVCHICGNLDLILDDVAAVGFAGVEVDYKTNLVKARDSLAGHSVMFGPIDPSGVFYFGSPASVAAKTREVLDIFRGRNIVIGAGCGLPAGVPAENLRAFVSAAREYPLV